jgi:signal transduction histidine kinase
MLAEDVEAAAAAHPAGVVRLLPAFDHHVVAAPRDSDVVLPAEFRERVYRPQAWLSPVLLVDGRMAGIWSHEARGGRLSVTVEPFAPLARKVVGAVEHEAARLAAEVQRAWRIKDDFLATLSHELRTPLNAMLGWVQLLRLHSDDAAMRNHAIEVLERNARAQVQIVADMLDVSRIITGGMRLTLAPLDLSTVVSRSCDSLTDTAAAKNVALLVDTEDLPGEVHGDGTRLQQVVWNLVSNAIKFTPAGGQVAVRVQPNQKYAQISVTDTGIGITPEVLPYVFDRFSQGDSSLTRAFGGLGLGLAIVRHLVELHGGSVHATSGGPSRGAAFFVRLPIHSPQRQA